MRGDCERFRPELSAHLDGELDPDLARALGVHLGGCGECTRRLEGLAALDAELRALPRIEASPQFEARLWSRIHTANEETASTAEGRVRRWLGARGFLEWGWVPAALVALALFASGGSEPLPEEDWALVADADTFELMLSDDIELVYALDELEAWDAPLEDI